MWLRLPDSLYGSYGGRLWEKQLALINHIKDTSRSNRTNDTNESLIESGQIILVVGDRRKGWSKLKLTCLQTTIGLHIWCHHIFDTSMSWFA